MWNVYGKDKYLENSAIDMSASVDLVVGNFVYEKPGGEKNEKEIKMLENNDSGTR